MEGMREGGYNSSVPHDYNPSSVEPKWQKKWADAKAYEVDLTSVKPDEKFYSMVMFPYPSGDKLHVGHWYNFAPADSFSRFMRLKGKTVFTPMGFDAFGLPAENYAIKTGVPPAESIKANVQTMITQLSRIGCMYDWGKMVNTSTPEYYHWTQWLFLQMYKHGLSYKKNANVNWCPNDQTVLANEQVKEGKCDRCGTDVVQKPLTQWFWQTTKYAQKLIDNLDDLDWPEKTKLMQKNWIGRSEGAEVHFVIEGHDEVLKIFSTRVDTIFGCTFVVLAPEHPLVEKITKSDHRGVVDAYVKEVKKKTEIQRTDLNKSKTGAPTGAFAINPATNERVPIWIADFVLAHYGSGAVFADAHDERDFIFAKQYNIPLKTTLKLADSDDDSAIRSLEICFSGDGVLYDSGPFTGLSSAEARKKIIAWLEDLEKGRGIINYRLRDWTISRQRYWGAPIPIVYDPEGNAHPIPEEHLPWMLPTDVEFKPTGESPLTHSKEFIERTEKIFGKGWRPEFDTMDTFVCSSFYYLRYLAEGDQKHIVDPHVEKNWLPVDMYIGGPEHATMHLIYARFVMMALKDMGFVSHDEPFKRLVHQGLITSSGAKMSKSKGNVVSPDSFVERYGSDVFRMYLMFMGPFTDGGDWNDTGIKGIDRFVQKVYRVLSESSSKTQDDPSVTRAIHTAVMRVTQAMEKLQFNIAISALMQCLNAIEDAGGCTIETARIFITLICPLAPHLAEELWEVLQGEGFAINQKWPTYDPALLVSDTLTIAVQINGKLRGTVQVAAGTSKEDIITAAKAEEKVKKYLEGIIVKKEIYVLNKLVNFAA